MTKTETIKMYGHINKSMLKLKLIKYKEEKTMNYSKLTDFNGTPVAEISARRIHSNDRIRIGFKCDQTT